MTAHNLQSLRIQDPVLTNLAQGYYNNELVCEVLMPIVEIGKEAGKIPQFGRQSFHLPSTIRQLRGSSNRLDPEDVTTIDVQLDEHDIEYAIDYREDNEASYPLKQYALSVTQDIIALGREVKVAEIAQNGDNYTRENVVSLEGTKKFSNKKSNPLETIEQGIYAISSTIGMKPNVCVISSDVWKALKENEVILERIKYTRTGILTPAIFAELIDIPTVKIGEAVQDKNKNGQLEKIWKDCVILAYVSTRANNKKGNVYDPSFGYTIRRNRGLFVDTYQENGGKVEVVRCTDIYRPHLLGKSAGYLIKDCL
ncbi:inorganic pyrophosphatase [Pasteurella sp. PK-2025]|uniref:inorganic pyrophosphatase n=1 Tax=Pasteurella sp. PK-2025 TaxID=3413133 RepID=UPI003C771E47